MTANQLKKIREEIINLKSQNVISVEDKSRIQKLQQTLDNILTKK